MTIPVITPTRIDADNLDHIENKIVHSLGERPSSSIGEIAKSVKVNRSTASKYVHVLKAKRRVNCRQVGPVKLWTLEETR